jgi:hypothetical protein
MCLHAITGKPGDFTEIAVLVVANLVATALRFALYRGWVFGEHADEPVVTRTATPTPSHSLGGTR